MLELLSALRFAQREVVRNIANFSIDFPQYLFTAPQGTVEHSYANQAAFIDVRIHSPWRNHIENSDLFTFLSPTINSSYSLLNTHRIPGQVIVHNAITELVVQAFTTDLGKQKNVETVILISLHFKTVPELDTGLIRCAAMNHSNPKTICV